MFNNKPADAELEISVFGPGKGECVVAHLGHGDWIVVDSCVDHRTKEPVALYYLAEIGVDAASSVKLVAATHWHDDHIRGLADVFRAAKNAAFVNSAAHNSNKLADLIALGKNIAGHASATEEYQQIVRILRQRAGSGPSHTAGPVRAIADRRLLLLAGDHRTTEGEVYALSPSDGTVSLADAELDYALKLLHERRRPRRQGANQLSVVLWIRVGAVSALLGGDLEHGPTESEGWQAIVASASRPSIPARIFKVPHHGSQNAHSPECWTHSLLEHPVAVLTPYTPSGLPTNQDLKRLCALAPQAFVTSNAAAFKLGKLDHTAAKMLRAARNSRSRKALEGPPGHVRIRLHASDASQTIELFNGAEKLCA